MKATVVVAVLAALLAGHQATVVKTAATRANLISGWMNPGDSLLYQGYVIRQAIANTVQTQDFMYRGNSTTRISAIQATEQDYTQYATPRLLSGGVNTNNVTLRFTSYRGYGFYYLVQIWGRLR